MEKVEHLEQRLDKINLDIISLKEKFEDHFLTDEERILIDEALEEKKKGELVSGVDFF